MEGTRPPRVFISYSHDSVEHQQRALALARAGGVHSGGDRQPGGAERCGELLDMEAEPQRILDVTDAPQRAGKTFVHVLEQGSVAASRQAAWAYAGRDDGAVRASGCRSREGGGGPGLHSKLVSIVWQALDIEGSWFHAPPPRKAAETEDVAAYVDCVMAAVRTLDEPFDRSGTYGVKAGGWLAIRCPA